MPHVANGQQLTHWHSGRSTKRQCRKKNLQAAQCQIRGQSEASICVGNSCCLKDLRQLRGGWARFSPHPSKSHAPVPPKELTNKTKLTKVKFPPNFRSAQAESEFSTDAIHSSPSRQGVPATSRPRLDSLYFKLLSLLPRFGIAEVISFTLFPRASAVGRSP